MITGVLILDEMGVNILAGVLLGLILYIDPIRETVTDLQGLATVRPGTALPTQTKRRPGVMITSGLFCARRLCSVQVGRQLDQAVRPTGIDINQITCCRICR